MSALTGNNVKDTYQGLLKLANSYTGITGNLQYVQDGLGHNIPLQVSDSAINLTGSIYFNNVLYTGTTNGSSGTSGTSGINGSSGTSGTSGVNGSSGTSGTSGSSGSAGTSGTSGSSGSSGTSGQNGSSGSSGTSGSSGSSGTSGQAGVSGSSGTSGTSGSSGSSGTSGQAGASGSSGSSGTSGSSGSSGTSGQAGASGSSGSSGTSGANGSSGSSGTSGSSGSSGTSGDSIFAQTGSYWNTTRNVGITGSLDVTGQLNQNGSIVISGSLITNATNNGAIWFQTEANKSGSLVQQNYISSSTPISQSNVFFSSVGPLNTLSTGSIVVSGSANIVLTAQRTNTIAQGTYGYINGTANILSVIPTLNTGSLLRPGTSQNIMIAGALGMNFITSSLTSPSIINNIISSTLTFNHQSGSLSFNNNYFAGSLTSTQNNIPSIQLPQISGNNSINGAINLSHISSSISFLQNYSNATSLTVTDLYSGSFSAATNGITVGQNIFGGNTVGVWVSGSHSSAQTRSIIGNIIGGQNTAVSSSAVNSNAGHLVGSIVYGQNLIMSASHAVNNGGTAFFGRYNDTASFLDNAQNIVFAVGTGTGTSNRRTGFWIDSGSIANVSGSMNVSGSLYIQSGSALPAATGSSLLSWNSSTGQVAQTSYQSVLTSTFAVGNFYSTGSVTTTANTSGSFSYTTTLGTNTINYSSGSHIDIPVTGTYNFQYSIQISQGSGAGIVNVWLKKNGSNVADTNTQITVPSNQTSVLALNLWDAATAGDYYELAYQSDSSNTSFNTLAASGNIPRTPAIIMTVNQVR